MRQLLFRYRLVLGFFIIGLIVSGCSAFPLQSELSAVSPMLGINDPATYVDLTGLRRWIGLVHFGLNETYARFPFFGYASDWLAFGHLVIAAFFVLPYKDPMRYRGILQMGLVACAGVLVVALVAGPIREIPLSWRLIDCSFGILGAIPLLYCLRLTRKMNGASSL